MGGYARQHSKVEGVTDAILQKWFRGDAVGLVATVFREWLHARRVSKVVHSQRQMGTRMHLVHKEQLWLAYQQIEDVNDSLQKELHLKKDLASKLDVAYSKLRGQQQSCSPGILSRYRTIRSPATRKPSDSPRTSNWPTPLRFGDVMPHAVQPSAWRI